MTTNDNKQTKIFHLGLPRDPLRRHSGLAKNQVSRTTDLNDSDRTVRVHQQGVCVCVCVRACLCVCM